MTTEKETATPADVEVASQEEQIDQTTEAQVEEPSIEAELAGCYAKIHELETYIAEADKREQDIQLRAQAEIQNIRRRTEQDIEKAHKFALEKFAKELLTVVDNLERGLVALDTAVTDEKTQALVDGVEMTHKEFVSTLAKFGIEAIGEIGDVFNPELHQAISMQPAENIEANHLSQVLQKGYTLQGRVIRPAMVMVAA
ncbi:nucleotide exchange factor GrpE [[Haemophilus] ducreyi]|uniref:Protein GrpE n=2 Tax=Haemophilus ducreyi TaxID=730 RepID=GRPE_HAEDU|nr:nucleotide exchange factor GrpE [[Haemophilus] ducreyi]Q7VMB7.1 RecName: Full=Protein GrpE; AltName: Full=HSP-70 cofactor [[Haemophilus] ducreyi 35000HP]AAP95940.1 heat shock protein GrpE [[Haemophilus] ducreyi 35000HP]AKO30947.1 molecular chaperone GrpE [[Haemophilus] ducreyi]AKO32386.1 molecular chaperone GrpE [[Haemophilus] ducreyi]AKO33838.1 molecular chaperone GrpE [[Haemophilus] ducreyi]AKO35284.1 molecular chaperone GrpE [[Haemophilus] ducreyi]